MNKEYIESLIVRLCKQPRTFEFISKNANGFDPVLLSETIQKLEKRKILQKVDDLWSVREKGKVQLLDFSTVDPKLYLKKYMGYFEFLKTPHPLDFEWRNSTSSLNYLINEVQTLNSVNDKILFLGMPTLFATALIKDIPQKVTLIERNKPIIDGLSKLIIDKERFQILNEDIFKVSPKKIEKYHCVIMDPPWYSPFFYQFMWLASQCVELNGIIGISLPPINTRPDIDKERIEWLSFCQKKRVVFRESLCTKITLCNAFFRIQRIQSGRN